MAWGALEVGKTGRVISGAVVAAGRVTRGKGVGEGLAARGRGGARACEDRLLTRCLAQRVTSEDDSSLPTVVRLVRTLKVLNANYGEQVGKIGVSVSLASYTELHHVGFVPHGPGPQRLDFHVDGVQGLSASRERIAGVERFCDQRIPDARTTLVVVNRRSFVPDIPGRTLKPKLDLLAEIVAGEVKLPWHQWMINCMSASPVRD